jgi:protein-tyrosine phosphatase
MTVNRKLTWDGCDNTRDLGGLMTIGHGVTRWGAVVRSDHPAKLSSIGWAALQSYGIRTIISLRTDGYAEDIPDSAPRPANITSVQAAIEDFTDMQFVKKWVNTELVCTPLYYRDALERWPERHAAAIAAVAHAQPGGVLIHCKRGNDRTGIISLLLLALAGVRPEEIIADYELSPDPDRDELLAREKTTAREALSATLAWLDAEHYLLSGGLSQADLNAVRVRLLQPVD